MIDLTLPLAATRLAIAALLAGSAVHKYRDFQGLRNAVAMYLRDTPLQGGQVVATLAGAVAAAEAVAGVMIALAWTRPYDIYAAVLGVAIFLLYGGAMLFNILRGNRIDDCGCTFGGQQKQPVGPALVVRNLLLALAAVTIAIPVQPTAQDWLGIVGFAALLLLMYAIWNELNSNRLVAGGRR